jgi:nucleosome binding factor SPN SPT16 subunit
MRNASKACVGLMKDYFVDEMSEILDSEKAVTHGALANKLDSKIEDEAFFKKKELRMPTDFDAVQLDWAWGPVVQSGGKYDLKLSATSDESKLHAGIIVAFYGLRYKTYTSGIARTYLVDPNQSQESNYKFLMEVHQLILSNLKEGAVAKDVYQKALALVKAKKPELEKHFVRNVGAGIGIEQRDPTLVLNAKNTRTLKDGMTLMITTGFSDIKNPDPQDKKSGEYSLVVSDTVRISTDAAVVFTQGASTQLEDVSFFFKDDEPAPEPKKAKKDSKIGAVSSKNQVKTKLRGERTTVADNGAEQRRREHQSELKAKKQAEGLENYAEAGGAENGTKEKSFKKFESYKRDNQLPSKVRDLMIVVDQKNQTVVLPIMGRPVPFHIQTIKNVSKNEEGEFTYLRINLMSPGQGVGRKDDQPFEDASAQFVRSMTFRSKDSDRMENICRTIQDMKKTATKKEQEKKEMEDVIEQDKLTEIRSKHIAFLYYCNTNNCRSPPCTSSRCVCASSYGRKACTWRSRNTSERSALPITFASRSPYRHPLQ